MRTDQACSLPGMLDDEYWSTYTSNFSDYDLGPTIGYGASSIVYSAICRCPPRLQADAPISPQTVHALDQGQGGQVEKQREQMAPGLEERPCAIKVSGQYPDIQLFFKESRLLSLCKHPNVLRNLATFTLPPDHQRIALVTPLISGGSLAGILDWRSRIAATPKASHRHRLPRLRTGKNKEDEAPPKGVLDEEEIKAVVKQVLEGLAYLHRKGFIHRDLKAGNLLVERDGTILLADFGVGGDMNDALTPPARGRPGADQVNFNGPTYFPAQIDDNRVAPPMDDSGKRRSFVGTPSWMAPEVILGLKYDEKADIWSLGITIIELASGAVPGKNDKQSRVLSKTITQPAPTLDRSSGAFSKVMKEFVDDCLDKYPQSRPDAERLLEHPWLKNARKKAFLADSLFADLPPLEARQEIRRVPSMSSVVSRASSWDFAASPSIPSTPMRSSFYLPVRSPSFLSQASESFSNLPKEASRSSTMITSIPPSPRISLRRWAERTASDHGEGSWSRSASESGQQRKAPIRRRPSVPFEQERAITMDMVPPPRARRLPSIEGGLAMGTVAEAYGNAPSRPLEIYGLGIGTEQPQALPSGSGPMSSSPDAIDASLSLELSRVSTARQPRTSESSFVSGAEAKGPVSPAGSSVKRSSGPGLGTMPRAKEKEPEQIPGIKDQKPKTHWWSRRPKEEKRREETKWSSLSRKPTVKKGEAA